MLPGELIAGVPLAQLAAFALPLGLIDLRLHRLPNVFTLPALACSQLALFLASVFDSSWARYGFALATLALVAGLGWVASVSGALGMGDVKLVASSAPLLAWFDPFAAAASLLIALGLAAVVVLGLALARRVEPTTRIAMGPYLLLGFIVSAVLVTLELLEP
jgi:leader peptidase (prepilin peptidase)/N-methyltransferase